MEDGNNKGFSLVELLAVLAIMAILAGIGIAAYNRYVGRARGDSYKNLGKSVIKAAQQYAMDHPGISGEIDPEVLKSDDYINNIDCPGNEGKPVNMVVTVSKEKEAGKLAKSHISTTIQCPNNSFTYDEELGYFEYGAGFDIEPIKNINVIKVLNVYGNSQKGDGTTVNANVLGKWMNSYGANKITVDGVNIEEFQGSELKNADGSWKYDVVVFGFNDCNGGSDKDISDNAYTALNEYVNANMPVIFGHDTVTAGNACNQYVDGGKTHANFNKFNDRAGLTLNKTFDATTTTKIQVIKSVDITMIPWPISKEELTIPKSHVYGQTVNNEDDVAVIFKYNNSAYNNKPNTQKSYLSVHNNIALIQTGHSVYHNEENGATPEEQKLIANLIFFMYRCHVQKTITCN